ncbi:MAG: hypothetical protein HQ564_08880 [Candidatus Saganbacteria bacterium]|nr:hypothetical protein [Candidatus Saganbacteria bacterium]
MKYEVPDTLNYNLPKLYKIDAIEIGIGLCMTGDKATSQAACSSGPTASGEGCGQGMAASSSCRTGTSPGTKCAAGTGRI